MPAPSAAMLRSPSSLRSLLRHSGRLLRPPNPPRLPRPLTPRLPSYPLSARPRFLSSSSSTSPAPGGAGWATYDPLTDTLSASAALPPPSASDSEPPPESEWGLFDPVAGRIVMQGSPPASSSTTAVPAAAAAEGEEEGEGAGESEGEEKGKVWASARVAKAQTKWSSVAAARKSPGKGGKERVSYACSNCGEAYSQWWGTCRYCNATGTVDKYVPGPDGDASAGGSQSQHVGRSWIPQKSKEMVPQSLQEVNKGVNQASWRIPLSGSFGMEISRVLGGGIVPGSLILVGGDPGVGKSSLMLQLASNILEGFKSDDSSPVVYVSGEESIEQIGNRADRMSIMSSKLYLYSGTDIEFVGKLFAHLRSHLSPI